MLHAPRSQRPWNVATYYYMSYMHRGAWLVSLNEIRTLWRFSQYLEEKRPDPGYRYTAAAAGPGPWRGSIVGRPKLHNP